MDQVIEKARTLLGWPTSRKLLQLAGNFPDEEAWIHAVESLEQADHPNEVYLTACLETETRRLERRTRRRSASPICPYSHGIICYGPCYGKKAKECLGEEECVQLRHHPNLRHIFDFNGRKLRERTRKEDE